VALKGRNSVMPAIKRVSDEPYKWKIEKAELKDVANKEKFMPRDFISADGFGITEVPAVPGAADPGRGLPALQERPAAVRAVEERGREEEAGRVQA
jgi:hypothetical protein